VTGEPSADEDEQRIDAILSAAEPTLEELIECKALLERRRGERDAPEPAPQASRSR
jgi:hypothetical protein